jgi:hypothetical protein
MGSVNEPERPLLLRRPQAWSRLGVGPSKYKEWVNANLIREISIGKRGRRVPLAELERFVAERLSKEEPPG